MSAIRKIPINTAGAGAANQPSQDATLRAGAGAYGPSYRPPTADSDSSPTAVTGSASAAAAADPGPIAFKHGASKTGPGGTDDQAEMSSASPGPDVPSAASAAEAAVAAAAGTQAPGVQSASDEQVSLTAERDAAVEGLLRLRAEFDNYRRRSIRELAESRERAQADILRELLPVLDNLERALDAAEHHEESKVLGGVRMTRDMFVEQLKRSGVQEIETVGAAFDPAIHEALAMQPSEHEEGLVAGLLEKGYRQGERVLRPARVVVSSGLREKGDGVGRADTAG